MKTVKDEKEWLRRMRSEAAAHEERKTAQKSVKERHTPKGVRKSGDGFKSVAGMEQLKQMVTEAFINVLKNSECADAYGIMPPSLLFYGPAGCGKTFFAERIADELGINFIKVVPDDLASTLVHGTQEKIGELFRKAEAKAPTLVFFDEFDAMLDKTYEENDESLEKGLYDKYTDESFSEDTTITENRESNKVYAGRHGIKPTKLLYFVDNIFSK